jgi:hypothetical protein
MAGHDPSLASLARDLRGAPPIVMAQSGLIMKRGALEVKKAMQDDLRKSKSFGHIARTVTFDHLPSDKGVIVYEVGPDADVRVNRRRPLVRRTRTGPPSPPSGAPLAGIAYFGGARGGGGSVQNPAVRAEEQMDAVADLVAAAVEKALA